VNSKKGFTLIEIVVALFMMSVAIVFATIVINTMKTTRDSAYEAVAFRIANSKLSELRAGGYAALPSSGTFSDQQLVDIPQGQASTTVSVWNAKTKQVLTGVSWQGADGTLHYVSMTTLVTETGGL